MNPGLNIFKRAQRYAGGEADVKANPLYAGTPSESALWRQLWEKYGGMFPEDVLYPDNVKERFGFSLQMAAGGDSDVEYLQGGSGETGRTVRSMTVGRFHGEPWQSANYHAGKQLGPWDVHSNVYPIGTRFQDQAGNWYTVRGPSFNRKKKLRDTVEFMNPGAKGEGKIKISPPGGWGGARSEGYGGIGGSQSPAGFGPQQQFTGNQGVGAGQVIVGGSGGFAPGVYTGELGGPGDPGLAQGKAPWDYLNPFGGTTKGGSNTGIPTQKFVGTAVGTASNLIFPGSGYITGPIARWITSMIQHGMSKQQAYAHAQQAVQQSQQEEGTATTGPLEDVTGTPAPTRPQGGGFDPYGNPARGREFWSGDFGRGLGGPSLSSAGGTKFGQFGTGFGTGTVGNFNTAIGFGGSYGGGSNAGDTSRFASGAGYSRPYTAEQWANLPGSKKYAAPALTNALGGVTPQMGYQQYLQMFHPIGSVGSSTGYGGAAYSGGGPKGVGGGAPSFKPNLNQKVFAMGTSSVNPGLKMFHAQLKRKK